MSIIQKYDKPPPTDVKELTSIRVEVLELTRDGEPSYILDRARTEDFGRNLRQANVNLARDRQLVVRGTLPSPQFRTRVIEYHNDDPDRSRTACVILFED